MPFRVLEIVESLSEKVRAVVQHGDHQVPVIIPNKKNDDLVVGESFQAGIGFDEILDWKIIDEFDDAKSGIWQAEDGIHLLGRIHSLIDFGNGRTMIDIYIRNGPEFLKLDLETVGDETFESNTGLEVRVGNLYLYPADRNEG
jgi:hypothetical protein